MMKVYRGTEIRNVAVVGHAHCGKTSLIAALLHAAKMTPRLGRVDDGSAVTAYDEEEVMRRTTMANAVAFAEWEGVKVNMLDTPGFHTFVHEARAAMLPVECALVVVNACAGVEAVTERVWRYAAELALPRAIVVNQLDHPKAECAAGPRQILEAMQARWGRQVVPVELPIVDANGFHGVVDLVTMQAYLYAPDGSGHGEPASIPKLFEAEAQRAHEALVELVAEGRDELLEEFFRDGTLGEEHLRAALHDAIREDRIFPVLYASGLRNVGTDHLLDFLKLYAPSPAEREPVAVRAARAAPAPGDGEAGLGDVIEAMAHEEIVMRRMDDGEPLALYVYKTMSDPFTGRMSFFKVVSGVAKNDMTVENFTRHEIERLAHLSVMQGRQAAEIPELHAGDLGAVPKLRTTRSGDTLGDRQHEIFFEGISAPEPVMTYAIEPKSRGDEDKLGPALHRLMEEDQMMRFYRDAETGEFLVAGSGQPHIEALISRLKRRYHTEVTLKAPKIPYRETIRAQAEAQGRHKKQTGGHGQYGDCRIRIEPLPRGSGIVFANEIFGGAIPRQFVPAVEKGIQESAARGYLAGYPVVDFKVTVFDGSYHEVDSSEMAFKAAARLAFRACMEQARPALLEPLMQVEIEAPEEFAGALMADLNGRRGRVQGMEPAATVAVIRAEVPLQEMLSYGATLTSLTQGKGSFRMETERYELLPQHLEQRVMRDLKLRDSAANAE